MEFSTAVLLQTSTSPGNTNVECTPGSKSENGIICKCTETVWQITWQEISEPWNHEKRESFLASSEKNSPDISELNLISSLFANAREFLLQSEPTKRWEYRDQNITLTDDYHNVSKVTSITYQPVLPSPWTRPLTVLSCLVTRVCQPGFTVHIPAPRESHTSKQELVL